MTEFMRKRHKFWFRAIAMIVACLFLVNDMSYGVEVLQNKTDNNTVSIPSRFNHVYGDSSTTPGDTSEAALEEIFKNDTSLVYVSRLIGKILTGWGSIMSEKPIRALIARHLSGAGDNLIDRMEIWKEGNTFRLTYTKEDGTKVELRYYRPGDKPGEWESKDRIAMELEGARVILESGPDKKKVPGTGEVPASLHPDSYKEEKGPGNSGKETLPDKGEKSGTSGVSQELAKYLEGKTLIDSIFEGGGAKGVAYVGALDELARRNMWFRKVAGTSAGAITASLIAAGYDNEEIKTIVFGTDFNEFKDWRWGIVPPWINLLIFGGLYRGRAFEKWISKKLKDKLGYEPTLKDLPIPLTVIASDISDEDMLVLDADTAPDLKVSEAVRMSMGIPFYFNVFRWVGKYEGKIKTRRVVDGGLLSNFPLFIFENDGKKGVPVLGFMLHEVKEKKSLKTLLSHILELIILIPIVHILVKVIGTGLDAHDKRQIEVDDWARIVNIPVNVGTTDFNITQEQKEELADKGREATAAELDKMLAGIERPGSTDGRMKEVERKGQVMDATSGAQTAVEMTGRTSSRGDRSSRTISPGKTAVGKQKPARGPSVPAEDDPRAVVENDPVKMAEEEAQDFIDSIVLFAIEAEASGKNVLLGIDTSFIPNIQMQTSAMHDLLKALKKMDLKNVVICQGKGDGLYGEIKAAREGADIQKSNIVIIGGKEALASDAFAPLKAENAEEIGAFFAEVIVPEGFRDDGDPELIWIATQAIREASKYQRASRRKEFFLKAEPVGIDKLVEKLEAQTERISA